MAFEPRIIGFLCNWCSYSGADLAGVSRIPSAPNLRSVRVMCTGRVDPTFVLRAFDLGADGVLISGCHPGDCHYAEGNYKMLRRFQLLKRMLKDLGIAEERLRLEWISAAEGEKFKSVINDMVQKITALGPLDLPGKCADWDRELTELAHAVEPAPAESEVTHA